MCTDTMDGYEYEDLDYPGPPPPKPHNIRPAHSPAPALNNSPQPMVPPRTTSRYVQRSSNVSG